ncbi:MAG: serine/threonine-protein phosphatase [Marinobacterium sp.]|nr:serine/threonine-protein phosphatase [Marinobacterium sp.]
MRIQAAFSLGEALAALESMRCAVVLACAGEDQVALEKLASSHYPRPLIALLPSGECPEHILLALRQGASDVFPLPALFDVKQPVSQELMPEPLLQARQAFVHSLTGYLERAGLIDRNDLYREELELSLAELREDQKAALHIQKRMLPAQEHQLPGKLSARYCLKPSLYLSGDFVDVVVLDQRYVMFYLADVSGHGASSALVTVLLKNMTNRLVRNFRRRSSFDILSPVSTLQRVNLELLETGLGKHLTMFIGLIDLEADLLCYAVGGHHPMPVLLADGQAVFLQGRGMPVGLFAEPFFDEHKLPLPAEFSLTLCSDGVLELSSCDSLADKEAQLCDVVQQLSTSDPDALRVALTGAPDIDAPDDIAIMILTRSQQ